MTRAARFFLISLALMLLLVMAAAILIDPYVAFRTPRIEGLTKYKPMGLSFMRMVKPYHVSQTRYDVLVTGSSRAGRGIDCRYFHSTGGRCYNAGLTGGGIYESYRFLQQRATELQRVVVFLDFFTFMRPEKAHQTFVEARLPLDSDGKFNRAYPAQAINDLSGLLLSGQTLDSGRKTLKWQARPYINARADGMLYLDDWGGWSFDPSTLDSAGQNVRVNRQVLRYRHILETMNSYFDLYAQSLVTTGQNIDRQIYWYKQMLELLYSYDMKASLVLPPSHASYWALLRVHGFGPRMEKWQRELIRINEELADRYARPLIPLFDFSGANPLALSSPPRRNSPKTFNRSFTDVMHFSRAVGKRMLDRLLAGCDGPDSPLFGNCISSANIDIHLQRQASLYREREPGVLRYLNTLGLGSGNSRSQR